MQVSSASVPPEVYRVVLLALLTSSPAHLYKVNDPVPEHACGVVSLDVPLWQAGPSASHAKAGGEMKQELVSQPLQW
jgi:hypothetical protein